MQTHKNTSLRASSVVPSNVNSQPKPYSAPKATATKGKFAAPKKEPVFELDGKKWKVKF